MIVQLQPRKDLKVELKSIWQQINDLRVAFFFLADNEHTIVDSKTVIQKMGKDKQLMKIVKALDELNEQIACSSFEGMEQSAERVLEEIDRGYFKGTLFKKFIEENEE